jgi:hypothetical protein
MGTIEDLRRECGPPTGAPVPKPTEQPTASDHTAMQIDECGQQFTLGESDSVDTLSVKGTVNQNSAPVTGTDCDNRIKTFDPCDFSVAYGDGCDETKDKDITAWWKTTLTICGETDFSGGTQNTRTAYFIANVNDQNGYTLYRKQGDAINPNDKNEFVDDSASPAHTVSKFVFVVPHSANSCAEPTPNPTGVPTAIPTSFPTRFPTQVKVDPTCLGVLAYTPLTDNEEASDAMKYELGRTLPVSSFKMIQCDADELQYSMRSIYKLVGTDKDAVGIGDFEHKAPSYDYYGNEEVIGACIKKVFDYATGIDYVKHEDVLVVVVQVVKAATGLKIQLVGQLLLVEAREADQSNADEVTKAITEVQGVVDNAMISVVTMMGHKLDSEAGIFDGVGAMFIGARNGAAFPGNRDEHYACAVASSDTPGRLLTREHECIAQQALRMSVTKDADGLGDLPTNSCWYPSGDADSDGNPNIADPCAANPHVNQDNHELVTSRCGSSCAVPDDQWWMDSDQDSVTNCKDLCPHMMHVPYVNGASGGRRPIAETEICIAEIRGGCKNETMFSDDNLDGYVLCEDRCPNNDLIGTPADLEPGKVPDCPCHYTGDDPFKDNDNDGTPNCKDFCEDHGDYKVRNSCGGCGPVPPDGCPVQSGSGSGSGSGSFCEGELSDSHAYECNCNGRDCTVPLRACGLTVGPASTDELITQVSDLVSGLRGRDKHIEIMNGGHGVCTCIDDNGEIPKINGVPTCTMHHNCKGSVVGAFYDACAAEPKCTTDHTVEDDKDACPITGKASCANVGVDSDGDGQNDCLDDCPLNAARKTYSPHHYHTDWRSCPCEWSKKFAMMDTDNDTVTDCWDVCGRRIAVDGLIVKAKFPLIHPNMTDDKVPYNIADPDKDGFPNCIDACPNAYNRDPKNASSPCVTRVEPAPGPDMPGADGSSSTTTKMLAAAVPAVAVLGVF